MATVKNNWIGFLDRSYQQIKNALLSKVTLSNPELTDHSPSNPFVILIDMFSAIAEMINYYIDNIAKESFIATASRRTSIINHSIGLDYRIKARNPESVDLTINFESASTQDFNILNNSYIDSIDGFRYRTLVDHSVSTGNMFVNLALVQVTLQDRVLGQSNGAANQVFQISNKYVHKTLEIVIGGEDYFEVDSFANSNVNDKHYIVDIFENDFAYVRFGDGKKGVVPQNGLNIEASYQDTEADDAKIDIDDFDENTLTLNLAGALPVTIDSIINLEGSSGGVKFESTESIRVNSVKSIRTLNRAVTEQDHIDILDALPGIRNTALSYCCGEDINLYIVPEGGGIAQSPLINEAQSEIDDKSMVLVNPIVNPAGESRLFIRVRVYPKPRKSLIETREAVEEALINYTNSQDILINSNIRVSDIQALVDNLPSVDYLDLLELWVEPYARPVGHNNTLDWTRKVKSSSREVKKWRLEIDAQGDLLVYLENVLQDIIPVGTLYNSPEDDTFEFQVNPGSYNPGDRWEFQVYPFLDNISLRDFTIAKITLNTLNISVSQNNTQSNNSKC